MPAILKPSRKYRILSLSADMSTEVIRRTEYCKWSEICHRRQVQAQVSGDRSKETLGKGHSLEDFIRLFPTFLILNQPGERPKLPETWGKILYL